MIKPNIIIVISDALRFKDLSLYGYPSENDRSIKRIASESLVFENNFSASNASDPSVTSLFSGKYPMTNGFIHQQPFMREEEINKLRKNKFWLPIYLREHGYSTISATPLHLWFKKGFDYYMEREIKGGKKILNIPMIKKALLKLPNWMYSLGKRAFKLRASPHYYSCREVVDLAISKINEAEKQKPFFLFMHLVDTHYPYPGVMGRKTGGIKTVKTILEGIESPAQREYVKKRFYDTGSNSLEEIEKKRDDAIRQVDHEMKRLSGFLRDKKLWENTVFIILSDHGDNFGEHNIYFCRGGLYDPSIHVPLIMHLPGFKHRRISDLTQNIDIAPTILDILGERNPGLDGRSMISLVKTGRPIREKILSSDGFCNKRTASRTMSRKKIVSDGSKCYLCGAVHGARKEEYNLVRDPEELTNLAKISKS